MDILLLNKEKKKNPLPIMVGHAFIEVASVVLILVTSISSEIYDIMWNMVM